jgi:hypothetical protein
VPTAEQINAELADEVAKYYADPLGFVLFAFPWGEDGPLKDHAGPDTWQREFLTWLGTEIATRGFDGVQAVAPIRGAVSSGHGIGKSTLQAWLTVWIMSTRPHCRGTVTANTGAQLDTKTWAAIIHWAKLSITAHWFEINTQRYYYKGHRESWFCAPQSCAEENSEAFAGQHAADSTSFYIFDEASNVPDPIAEVAEGGLTDGEPMIFLFGNPTKSTGFFYRRCFGAERNRWQVWTVDSRDSKFTNKAQIAEWVTDYGEDSDFVRVRVRGLAPSASDLQFIDSDRVRGAQKRPPVNLPDDPLVCALDMARGGGDSCVFRFRRGLDARSIPAKKVTGQESRDSMKLVAMASDILSGTHQGQKVATLFVDATGGSVGGPVADRLRQLGHSNVIDVQFGGESPDPKYANMRAYMWGKMRDWLTVGAIDTSARLEQDLTAPGYTHDKRDRVVLESKEHMKARGVDSPDDGDALAMTFALSVAPRKPAPAPYRPPTVWN